MQAPSGYAQRVSTGRRVLRAAQRVAVALAYFLILVAVAVGSAGVVAMWSHPPGTAARAELTWDGDSTLTPHLDAARTNLTDVAASVDRLALLARGALAALNSADHSAFSSALSDGTAAAAAVQDDSTALRARLQALPGADPAQVLLYSGDVLARRSAMIAALDSTQGLSRSWATLTAGSLQASQLLTLLADHDSLVAAAAGQGRGAQYAAALATLAGSIAKLDAAVTIRDKLVNSTDVSTIDDWIARNRRYDLALTALYAAFRDSAGKVTDAVRTAFQEEGDARAQLPPDNRGLTVIIADIGRGGLNQAVIAIEQARTRLDLALQALSAAGPAGAARTLG